MRWYKSSGISGARPEKSAISSELLKRNVKTFLIIH
jgi:hypothetical protein